MLVTFVILEDQGHARYISEKYKKNKVGRKEYEIKERIRKIGIKVRIRKPLREKYKLDPKYDSLHESNI